MMKNIFCIGGACIDYKLKAAVPLISGTSNPATTITSFGGVARNIAENLARWTQKIHLQCIVGDDNEGRQLLEAMQSLGINTNTSLQLKHQTTSHYYAVLNQNGNLHIALADMNIYNHIPITTFSQAWDNWPDASIVFIDTNLPATLIEHAMEQSQNKNHLLCIDPVSITKADRIPASLEGIFLIKPNQQEACALTNISIHSISDCFTAGRILIARGAKNVVISLGKSGYVIVNERQQNYFASKEVNQIKDVNGAGDAFVAGILLGLQQNLNLTEACQLGAAAAALTIQSFKTVAESITAAHLINHINHSINSRDRLHATIF